MPSGSHATLGGDPRNVTLLSPCPQSRLLCEVQPLGAGVRSGAGLLAREKALQAAGDQGPARPRGGHCPHWCPIPIPDPIPNPSVIPVGAMSPSLSPPLSSSPSLPLQVPCLHPHPCDSPPLGTAMGYRKTGKGSGTDWKCLVWFFFFPPQMLMPNLPSADAARRRHCACAATGCSVAHRSAGGSTASTTFPRRSVGDGCLGPVYTSRVSSDGCLGPV